MAGVLNVWQENTVAVRTVIAAPKSVIHLANVYRLQLSTPFISPNIIFYISL